MNALQRFFGRDHRFFDLLDSGAAEARRSASLLLEMAAHMGTPEAEAPALEIAQCRRKHKRISQDLTRDLCKTFITPLEREDIEELSVALYKVPKTVEKIAERLSVSPGKVASDIVLQQINMLEQATGAVAVMVKELRRRVHVETIMDTYDTLQTIEGDADKLMVGLLKDLYQGQLEPKEAMILKDLYELLERAIDRCRDAGNVVFRVVLKYS